MILNLCIGVDIRRYINLDGPFVLISSFGNKEFLKENNPSGEYTPHVLLKNDEYVNNIKKFGMLDYLNVFHDDTTPEKLDLLLPEVREQYITKLFDKDDAKSVYDFAKKWIDSPEKVTLVSHCDAGISRSSGIAVSICDHFNITKDYIHKSISPNSNVVMTCMEVFDEQ